MPSRARVEAVFVWTLLAGSSIAALAFARIQAPVVPLWDDSIFVPLVAGRQPLTLSWLWTPHNEHRIPLPKLAGVAIGAASGMDGRVAATIQVLLLSAGAVVLILALRRRRGTLRWTDALVPLLLLHWGHWENFAWRFQIAFVLHALLICLLLALFLVSSPVPSNRWAAGAGICLLLLPLCGAGAIPFGMLIASGWIWNEVRSGRRAVAWPSAAILLCVASLLGFTRGAKHPSDSPIAASSVALQSLAGAFGSPAERYWPLSGLVALLLVIGTGAMLWRGRSTPGQRETSERLLLALGGVLGLAMLIGIGRSGLSPLAGFTPRYALLLAPLPILCYAAAELRGAARIQASLFVLSAAVFVPNAGQTWDLLREFRDRERRLTEEVRAGLPIPLLAARHARGYAPVGMSFEEGMRLLASSGLAVYRGVSAPLPTIFDEAAAHGASLVLLGDQRIAVDLGPDRSFWLPLNPGPRRIRLEFGLFPEDLGGVRLAAELDGREVWSGGVDERRENPVEFDVEARPDSRLGFSLRTLPGARGRAAWLIPSLR